MKVLRWMVILLCFVALPAFAQKAKVNDYATRLASLLSKTTDGNPAPCMSSRL